MKDRADKLLLTGAVLSLVIYLLNQIGRAHV